MLKDINGLEELLREYTCFRVPAMFTFTFTSVAASFRNF
jgi:hypothetical protein